VDERVPRVVASRPAGEDAAVETALGEPLGLLEQLPNVAGVPGVVLDEQDRKPVAHRSTPSGEIFAICPQNSRRQ
jgi:hypothetical protein